MILNPYAETPSADYMAQALAYFGRLGWRVERHETAPVLRFALQIDPQVWTCRLWLWQDRDRVVFHAAAPKPAPEVDPDALASFVAEINLRLETGCFLFDVETGDLGMRVGLDLGAAPLSDPLLHGLVGRGLTLVEQTAAPIGNLMAGKISVEDAIKGWIEADSADDVHVSYDPPPG